MKTPRQVKNSKQEDLEEELSKTRTKDRGPDENLGIDINVQKKKMERGWFISRLLVRETRNHFRDFKPRGI